VSDPPVRLSAHARRQAARRGIDEQTVLEVAGAPEQVLASRPGREARQARTEDPATGRSHFSDGDAGRGDG